MRNNNVYLEEVHNILPRLLSLYDTDPVSNTLGVGDRYYWAWKLTDFGNGTFQGAAHGLARLLIHDLLPAEISKDSIFKRIDDMYKGAKSLRYSNGSLVEAFPYESSFCVTALVAYDLLSAVELLTPQLEEKKRECYLDIVRPMIGFLHQAEETHAFISNHLSTAAAALLKWSAITGESGEMRGCELLDRILAEQSEEGWFREYEGADVGYETLSIYYLSDIHKLRPDLGLLSPLKKSIRFLWHFAHPDGSFGGYYGSRNTRFYYPAGIEAMALQIPEAKALADFMRKSIAGNATVTLKVMDGPNLIPMFNAYCYAAANIYREEMENNDQKQVLPLLPSKSKDQWRLKFPEAGLLIDKGENHYTIISWHKGGVCYHFHIKSATPLINYGVVARSVDNKYYSSQSYNSDNLVRLEGDAITIISFLTELKQRFPDPLQFIVLRLFNVTIMRAPLLGNLIKKLLVKYLITGKNVSPVRNCRTIVLGSKIAISDTFEEKSQGFNYMEVKKPFKAIHMASQGYWQKQYDAE